MKRLILFVSLAAMAAACKKDGNPHNLPGVSPDAYAGKIDGYASSDEVFSAALVAYWPFDGSKNEQFSGAAPTATGGDAFVDAGVRGKALSLTAGYLYFAQQFGAFRTDSLKSFTISQWIQVLNNGSKKTMVFQVARPGIFNGNINVVLETNRYPATELEKLTIHPTFTAANNGMQDNLNTANGSFPFLSPKIGMDKWTHIVVTYDGAANNFQIWADGVKVGVPAFQNRGANFFKSHEPSEVIIGANYNTVPGKTVNADATFAAMTGNIDEVRVYKACLTDAHIKALYNLGLEKK